MNANVLAPLRGALTGLISPPIERVLDLARNHLQMDVAFLSEFSAGRQLYRAVVASEAEPFGIRLGEGPELATTYCQRMVAGQIPNVIPDSQTEPLVRELAATIERNIRSYIGVPLRLSDGSLYGTFCCLGRNAETLDARDVGFMSMLAEILVEELDIQQRVTQDRSSIAGILASGSADIAFQPIVDLHGRGRLGVEALSRFPAGFGAPDVVFRTAHAVGLGMDLESAAVRQAASFLPRIPGEQYMAVNLSPAAAHELSETIFGSDAVDLHRLVLEITETAAVDGYAALRCRLAPLRERGLRLAIDDAGAGYASLHHIVELRPDIIKIDRSLIDGMASDSSRRSAVRAFISLARDLGADTVAEGIETLADLEVARELGITAAQGYFLGRPSTDRAILGQG